VVLDSLIKDVPYLLNIDGFLGDECGFTIQVADKAAGFPENDRSYQDSHSNIELNDSVIRIATHMGDVESGKISKLLIYKSYLDGQLSLFDSIAPARNNALGEFITDYSYYDTLHSPGAYTYKVFGAQHDTGELLVLGERKILYYGIGNREGIHFIELPRALNRSKPITVRLINPPSGQVLENYTRNMESKSAKVQIDFAKYTKAGYRDFVLELSNENSDKTELIFYRVTTDGRIIRR